MKKMTCLVLMSISAFTAINVSAQDDNKLTNSDQVTMPEQANLAQNDGKMNIIDANGNLKVVTPPDTTTAPSNARPMQPAQPVQAAQPMQSTQPMQPVQPTQPMQTNTPAVAPMQPINPEVPTTNVDTNANTTTTTNPNMNQNTNPANPQTGKTTISP